MMLTPQKNPYINRPERFSINTADWSLQRRHLLPEASYEFPAINYAYNTHPYSYSYILLNSYVDLPQSVLKVRD